MGERARPDAEADRGAGRDRRSGRGRAEEPGAAHRQRHDVPALGRRRFEDALAQPDGRRRRLDRPGEGAGRVGEGRELVAAPLATAEVGLVLAALFSVERVERVGGGQVVDVHEISIPGSPSSSRKRARPMNIRL